MSLVALVEANDIGQYGGKAANLAVLIQAGLPVPMGYAISVASFNREGDLNIELAEALKQMIEPTKLYAVRSSALHEDAAGASWAGQFESFLNTKPENLIEIIEKCHGSAKERAKAYAKSMNESSQAFNVAVIVQEMISPEHAGVLFTRDPVTGADKYTIEYVEGLGEQLVSGQVTPELVVWADGPVPETPFNIHELISIARQAERLFKVPQDIEWASFENKIWLLQARPITNL